jgi:7-cyano-7-deazaguanine synthase in queuosine biosynthesis
MLAASLRLRCVYLGYHKEPKHAPFPDATSLARSRMDLLLRTACRPPIEVVAPFEQMTREEILTLGLILNPSLPSETFTCYESELDRECGQCAHCKRKARMLKKVKAQTGPECEPPKASGENDELRRRKPAQSAHSQKNSAS